MRLLVSITLGAVCAFAAPVWAQTPVCSVGDKAEVLWKGKWYGARVNRVNETQTQCFIRYDGYGSEWDEWVGADRIKVAGRAMPGFKVADPVQVLWKGKWYPASVIAVGQGQWRVHYDGYGAEWDEWVGPGRIKAR